MNTATAYRYISTDEKILGGEPIIWGTRTPVRAIVENWQMGSSAEEIVQSLPHLTLAQIFEAMSYYYDNQAEIDKYIEQNQIPDKLLHPQVKNL